MPIPIDQIIMQLRALILNARLYPQGSPVVTENLDNIEKLFVSSLEEVPEIDIHEIEGKLYLNTAPVLKNELHVFFQEHEVQNIVATRGTTREEISWLIEGLGQKKNSFPSGQSLNDWLQSKGAQHVSIREFQYVAVRKGEDVARQVRLLFDRKHDTFAGLLATLERSARMMEEIKEGDERGVAEKQLIDEFSALSPQLLRDFYLNPLPERMKRLGLKPKLTAALSENKISEIYREVGTWAEEIRAEKGSMQEVEHSLGALKQFIEDLAGTPAGKQIDPELYRSASALLQARNTGSDAVAGTSSVEARIGELLEKPSEALMDPSLKSAWPALLNMVGGAKQENLADRLILKVSENLQSSIGVRREAAVQWLRQFQEILAAHHMEKPQALLVERLMESAGRELEPLIYGQITQVLQSAATEDLLQSRFVAAARILSLLRQHAFQETSPSRQHSALAIRSLEIFAQRNVDALAADLISGAGDRLAGAQQILAILGEEALESLLAIFERTSDPRLRQFAIQNLRRVAGKLQKPLALRLTSGAPVENVLRLLPLLALVSDEDRAVLLPMLLEHPEAGVRREAARLLPSIRGRAATPDLLRLLEDTDAQVKVQAMRVLHEKRDLSALDEILKKAETAVQPLQEEICLTLGDWKDPKALPILMDLLDLPAWPWSKSKKIPDAVREKAVWALGQFLPDRQVLKVLKKAAQSPSRVVSLTARSVLARSAPK